jgi:2',3'-cyclic-nucleotide 2'-phosphodiesterase (5'-nucleotidase family)
VKPLALALMAAGLSSCTSGAKFAPNEAGDRVRIFYNNDNFAYLETCGCRVSPIGGMDRRWNAMKAYPDGTRVFLDAGNLLFKSAHASEFLAPQWYEQAAGVIEAYNLLGADAVEPGETDFALGIEKFRELAAKANFPFISANLVTKDDKPFLPASVIIKRLGK